MITFDVDSVLLKTEEKILKEIKKLYNKELSLNDITYWNFYKDNYPEVMKLFDDYNFYNDIEPVKYMDYILSNIIKEYGYNNIQIVTSTNKTLKQPKEICLDKHFGKIKNFNKIKIIHVGMYLEEDETNHEKYHYTKNTILIDDGLHNIIDHLEYNKNHALLIDYNYGWNKNYNHNLMKRINNPHEIENNLKELIKFYK